MDFADDLKSKRTRYYCSFRFGKFIQVADPDLHSALKPYSDVTLVEAHGEQLLDLYIWLASELDWK